MIDQLFPDEVIACLGRDAELDGELFSEEKAWLGDAAPRRREEFRRGRVCARRALAQFGIEDYPILVGPGRAPVWPHGIVGSISHCEGLSAAAVTQQDLHASLGIDVEVAGKLEAKLANMVCRAAELERMETLPELDGSDWPRVHFCLKESVYKCSFPVLGRWLEWHDVEVEVDAERGEFKARLLDSTRRTEVDFPALRGRFRIDDEFIYSGVTLSASDWIEEGPP